MNPSTWTRWRNRWTRVRTVLWWPVAAVISFAGGLLAFPLAPIAVWRAQPTDHTVWVPWSGKNTEDVPPMPQLQTMYRVPRWLRWLETQDDHDGLLPAGLYEPTILDVYWQWGWRWASIRWLWRNRAFRLAKWVGKSFPQPNVLRPPSETEGSDALARIRRDYLLRSYAEMLRDELPALLDVGEPGQRGPGQVVPNRPGWWLATIEQYADGVLVRFAFNLVLVTPPWFFGRALWLPIGWHLHEFFDSFWTPGVQWPGPDDATGRVAPGLPRLEKYPPQGAQ
jgi:hypothetical protein